MGYGSTVLSIGGGIAGGLLGGPWGAAAGAGLGSAAGGGNLKQDLTAAAFAGLGSGISQGFGAAGSAAGGATDGTLAGNSFGVLASDAGGSAAASPWAGFTPGADISSGYGTGGGFGSAGIDSLVSAGSPGYAPVYDSAMATPVTGNAATGTMDSLAGTMGYDPTNPNRSLLNSLRAPWGSPMNLLRTGSGLYNIYQGNKMQQLAQQQMQVANNQRAAVPLPTAQSVANTPGYQSGMDAVQRSMLAQGYQGSGNMMAALQQYGGQAYQNAYQNYSNNQQLANQSAQVGTGITSGANTMMGGGLASLGQAAFFAGL